MTTLFDVTPSIERLTDKPRDATAHEVDAYLVWIALRRGVYLPADARFSGQGIFSNGELILEMPGYGQSQTVTCEILDDAGEVVRSMPLPVDKRGKLPMTAAQAKDWTGLAAVKARKPRKAAVMPAQDAAAPEAIQTAPAPVAAPAEAPSPVPAPVAPIKAATLARATRAIAMLSGERRGLGTRAFDNCFEAGDGDAVAAVMLERIRTDADTARSVRNGRSSFTDQGERVDVVALSYLSPAMMAAAFDRLGEVTPRYAMSATMFERVEALRECPPTAAVPAPAPIEETAPMPAPQYGSAAADLEATAAIEAAGLSAPTDNEAAPIWRQYVATAYGVGPDGWTLSVGPQRDRKARNRGLVVLDTDAQAVLASHFAALFPQHAPALPCEPAPIAVADADLARTVAQLAARVAALETGAAPAVRPARTAAHLRAIRAYLQLRADRTALRAAAADLRRRNDELFQGSAALYERRHRTAKRLVGTRRALAQARINEAAVRKSVQVQALDLMRLQGYVDQMRDDTVAAEVETLQTRAALDALKVSAAADRAELDRLAPVVQALSALNRPALARAA